jgi:hypothetical protein
MITGALGLLLLGNLPLESSSPQQVALTQAPCLRHHSPDRCTRGQGVVTLWWNRQGASGRRASQ